MRNHEQIQRFELMAADVKRGDKIAVVGPWNFFRGDTGARRNSNGQIDQYSVTYWTVAAIGKKIMRLTNNGTNARLNIYIMDRPQGELTSKGFSIFVSKPERALALAGELHLTDQGRTANFWIVYPDRLY